MSQAMTFQAHDLAETDYDRAVALQEAGSELLRMPQEAFAKQIDVKVS